PSPVLRRRRATARATPGPAAPRASRAAAPPPAGGQVCPAAARPCALRGRTAAPQRLALGLPRNRRCPATRPIGAAQTGRSPFPDSPVPARPGTAPAPRRHATPFAAVAAASEHLAP